MGFCMAQNGSAIFIALYVSTEQRSGEFIDESDHAENSVLS